VTWIITKVLKQKRVAQQMRVKTNRDIKSACVYSLNLSWASQRQKKEEEEEVKCVSPLNPSPPSWQLLNLKGFLCSFDRHKSSLPMVTEWHRMETGQREKRVEKKKS